MFLPITWKTGSARSNASSGPPTMIDSAASIAPFSPPETGASSIGTSFPASRSANRRVGTGAIELMSITSDPSRTPSATPPSPKSAASTSGVSGHIVMTMSLAAATPAEEPPRAAPASTSSSTGAGTRLDRDG
jgi:hypothetical protein